MRYIISIILLIFLTGRTAGQSYRPINDLEFNFPLFFFAHSNSGDVVSDFKLFNSWLENYSRYSPATADQFYNGSPLSRFHRVYDRAFNLALFLEAASRDIWAYQYGRGFNMTSSHTLKTSTRIIADFNPASSGILDMLNALSSNSWRTSFQFDARGETHFYKGLMKSSLYIAVFIAKKSHPLATAVSIFLELGYMGFIKPIIEKKYREQRQLANRTIANWRREYHMAQLNGERALALSEIYKWENLSKMGISPKEIINHDHTVNMYNISRDIRSIYMTKDRLIESFKSEDRKVEKTYTDQWQTVTFKPKRTNNNVFEYVDNNKYVASSSNKPFPPSPGNFKSNSNISNSQPPYNNISILSSNKIDRENKKTIQHKDVSTPINKKTAGVKVLKGKGVSTEMHIDSSSYKKDASLLGIKNLILEK